MAYNITRKAETSTTKKLAYLIVVIICLVLIHNLIVSTYNLWHKQDLVTAAQNNLAHEKAENQRLKSQLKVVGSSGFMEEQARNELFMVKPGESGVILPSNIGDKKGERKVVVLSPWQAWLKAFGLPY